MVTIDQQPNPHMSPLIRSIIKLFADDTILMATCLSSEDCVRCLQPDRDRISAWATLWKITMNPMKTKCLTVSRLPFEYAPLMLQNTFIEEVTSHQHIGVTLQLNGKWGKQISKMIERAESRIYILKGHARKLGRGPLRPLYLAYIRPILEHACIVCGNIIVEESDRLESIQRTALRLITGSKLGSNRGQLYKELDLPLLNQRRWALRLCKLWEILHRDTPGTLNSSSFPKINERNPYSTRD